MMAKSVTTTTTSKIANYITLQIKALEGTKSQRDIAREMGYEKANIISMFKTGEVKVPLDKIPAMAKALNVDPANLFRLAMQQYWPDMHEAIEAIFGSITTAEERKVLARIKELAGTEEIELTSDLDSKLRKVFLRTAK